MKPTSMTPTGQVELERYGNNSEQQFQYNPSTWQLNASTAASLQPNQNYFDLNYRYDLFGNISKKTKAWPVSDGANNNWCKSASITINLHRLRISERTWGTETEGAMGSGQSATIDFECSPNGNMIRAYNTGGLGGNADRKLLKFDALNKSTRIPNSGLD